MKINIKHFILLAFLCFVVVVRLTCLYPDFINSKIYLLIKDYITLLISIAGLYIAGGGLFTWRSQIEYTKEKEVANNLHLSLLKLRDAVKHVRNPAIFPSESYKAFQDLKNQYPDLPEKDIESKTHPYVYELRWEKIQDASTLLDTNLLAAEVLWGEEVNKLIIPLRKKISELNIALKQKFQPEVRTQTLTQISEIVYDTSWSEDREDSFGQDVKDSIDKVMKYINKKIV